MNISSKYKICKRLGSSVFEKCQTQKFMLSESRAAKGKRGGRRQQISDYGRQLLEKQRMRFTYGISEKQFSGYVQKAMENSDEPREALIQSLESRLDNVVYRAGLAKTRRLARQLVSHGHITVDGRKVTIPSFNVKLGQKIAVREQSKAKTYFEHIKNTEEFLSAPAWFSFDTKTLSGEMKTLPKIDDVDLQSDLTDVFSYYTH